MSGMHPVMQDTMLQMFSIFSQRAAFVGSEADAPRSEVSAGTPKPQAAGVNIAAKPAGGAGVDHAPAAGSGVTSKPVTTPGPDTVAQQQLKLATGPSQPYANPKTSELLTVLRSPLMQGNNAAIKSELQMVFKALSQNFVLNQNTTSASVNPSNAQPQSPVSNQVALSTNSNLLAQTPLAPMPAASPSLAQTGAGQPPRSEGSGPHSQVANPVASEAGSAGTGAITQEASVNQFVNNLANGDVGEPFARLTAPERNALLLLLSEASLLFSTSQQATEAELPVMLNAGMLPGALLMKTGWPQAPLAKGEANQILQTLNQLGVEPSLLKKFKKYLNKSKTSRASAMFLLAIFVSLYVVAQHIFEELSFYFEEDEEFRERISYADSSGFSDERRRIFVTRQAQ